MSSSEPSTSLIRQDDIKRTPGVSLNRQVVLEEDEYTEALSHIIKRDFFPNLNRLSATNNYLAALEDQDSAGISSAIRNLSAIGRASSSYGGESSQTPYMTERRRREEEIAQMSGTPYISRTPFGGEGYGLETPMYGGRRDNKEEDESSKKRKVDTSHGLDDFQHIYTSEDNASFIDILHDENRLRRERFAWAYEHEAKERAKRLSIEQGRRTTLIAAGENAFIQDDGVLSRRVEGPKIEHRLALTQGHAEQGLHREDGRAIARVDKGKGRAVDEDDDDIANRMDVDGSSNPSQSLIRSQNADSTPSNQLILPIPNSLPIAPITNSPDEDSVELLLNPSTHLARALHQAGLPETAIVNLDGDVVPVREMASGSGDGLGRGVEEREKRERVEREVVAESKDMRGKVVPAWAFKARNPFMFGPDVDVDPTMLRPSSLSSTSEARQAPPQIQHANTRLPDEDDDDNNLGLNGKSSSSRRGTSPSRSKVAAAIGGTPYRPASDMPTFNNYPLVPVMPSPSPSELGPQAVSELMTWGTLLSTPRAIGSNPDEIPDMAPSAFKISESNNRDRIGRNLATSAARAMKERAKGYGTAPRGLDVLSSDRTGGVSSSSRGRREGMMGPPSMTPSATPRRTADTLTPAGRTLLERTSGASPLHRRGEGLGLPTSAGRRSRGEAMEKMGGWSGLGKRDARGGRTWTPSPAPVRRKGL